MQSTCSNRVAHQPIHDIRNPLMDPEFAQTFCSGITDTLNSEFQRVHADLKAQLARSEALVLHLRSTLLASAAQNNRLEKRLIRAKLIMRDQASKLSHCTCAGNGTTFEPENMSQSQPAPILAADYNALESAVSSWPADVIEILSQDKSDQCHHQASEAASQGASHAESKATKHVHFDAEHNAADVVDLLESPPPQPTQAGHVDQVADISDDSDDQSTTEEDEPSQSVDASAAPVALATRSLKRTAAVLFYDTVRNKAARAKLTGYPCSECQKFFEATGLKDSMVCEHASRHRYQCEPPSTPPGFWDI